MAAAEVKDVPELDEMDDAEGDDWEECPDEEMTSPCTCLFCPASFPSPENTLEHCSSEHNFDIIKLRDQNGLDCFGFIKLVNFTRIKNPTPETLQKSYRVGQAPWDSDQYMKPALEADALLQFDIEDYEGTSPSGRVGDVYVNGGGEPDSTITLNLGEYNEMLLKMKQLEEKANLTERALQDAMQDFTKLRTTAQEFVMSQPLATLAAETAIQSLTDDEDDVYFGSYGHFGIHEDMLKDRARTESYRDCMYQNKEFFKDKVVLDVGCGTGILSMFAATAGAKLVIGVDQSDIIYQAIDIVRENGLEDKIKLLKGRMEDVDLPVDKVDIIISEWMGYFLLFESMLDTVVWARDHYLRPGGVVLPDYCNICLVGLDDAKMHDSHIKYWEDVYGFKMNCMKSAVYKEASVTLVDKNYVMTDVSCIKEIDTCTCSVKDLEFTSKFSIKATRDGHVTALCAYFDIGFDRVPNKVKFSTAPDSTPTHWKQTVFLLTQPIQLNSGQGIDGQLRCLKNRKDPRSLIVIITIKNESSTYYLQ